MKSLMGGKPKTPAPAQMPDEESLKNEKRKKAAQISARSGRESTILQDSLGG
jgi:hypothetical protein